MGVEGVKLELGTSSSESSPLGSKAETSPLSFSCPNTPISPCFSMNRSHSSFSINPSPHLRPSNSLANKLSPRSWSSLVFSDSASAARWFSKWVSIDNGIDVEVVALEGRERDDDGNPGSATAGFRIDVPDNPRWPRPGAAPPISPGVPLGAPDAIVLGTSSKCRKQLINLEFIAIVSDSTKSGSWSSLVRRFGP